MWTGPWTWARYGEDAFVEIVRPSRPELAASEGTFLSSRVVNCRTMETASIVPQGTESTVRGLVYPRSDGGFAGIKRARHPGALIKSKKGGGGVTSGLGRSRETRKGRKWGACIATGII